MAEDANARIRVDIDTAAALANIKNLQRQISAFHTSMAKGGAAAAATSLNMQQGLLNSINQTGKFSATIRNVKSTTDSFTDSLQKNKLSMGEYFRYAGASTKTFGRFFRTEFDTINKVARERVKDLQTQYIKMGRDANGAMRAIAVRPLALDMENLGTKTQIAAQRQALLNQLLKQGSTNLLNFGKNTQWAGRQLMVGFTIPLVMFGSVAAKAFMDVEAQAVRFKRVYGELFTTGEETNKAISDIKNLANEFTRYGIAVSKTMELAADIAAMGRMGAELNAQVAETTRLAVLGGVDQQEALKATISITDAFGVSATELAGKIDFLNAVENQTITSIEDLTIAIPKAGPVVKQLGGDVEDLTFFLTAMREGGINASEGANALKSGLAALINPTRQASEMLQGFGINITGIVEANAGDVKGLVLDFATALDTLDPLNRARAIEQLFGKFQFSRLSTLFQNVIKEGNQASRVLGLTNATTAELAILSEREMKRIEDSPMFKFQKAIEDIKVTLVPLGEAFLKAVTPLLEFGTSILKKFDELDEGAKGFVVGLTAIAGVIGPVFLMGFGLVANGVANVIKMFAFFKASLNKAGTASTQLGMQTDYMTQQQLEAAAVAASLDQIHQKLRQTFTSETAAVNALTAAYSRSIAAQGAMTGGAIGRTRPNLNLASGIMSVPGPKGAGDVVPAMLSPGEAVIPARQSKKYRGIISSVIADNVPGFRFGRNPFASMLGRSKVAVRMKDQDFISELKQSGKNARYKSAFDTQTGADYIRPSGSVNERQKELRSAMERDVFKLDPKTTPTSERPTYGYARTPILSSFINRLFGIKGKNFNAVTRNVGEGSLAKYGNIDLVTKGSVAKRSSAFAGDALVRYHWAAEAQSFKRRAADLKVRLTRTGVQPAPMKGASPEQLGSFDGFGSPFKRYKNEAPAYVETYTPGGFAFNEIDKIIARDPAIAKALRQELKAAGLGGVRVVGSGFAARLFKKMGVPGYEGGIDSVPDSALSDFEKLRAQQIRDIQNTTRGAPPAFKAAHDSLPNYSSGQAEIDEFIDIYEAQARADNVPEEKIRNAVKKYRGFEVSHLSSDTRIIDVDGIPVEVKNWRSENVARDYGAVNQIFNDISRTRARDAKGKIISSQSLISSLDPKEIARIAGISEKDAREELRKLDRGVHPVTAKSSRVLSAVADKYLPISLAQGSVTARARVMALKQMLSRRIADGSFFSAVASGQLSLPAGSRAAQDADAARAHQNTINNNTRRVAEARTRLLGPTSGVPVPSSIRVEGGGPRDNRMIGIASGETVLSDDTTNTLKKGGAASVPGIGRMRVFGRNGRPMSIPGADQGIPEGQTQEQAPRRQQARDPVTGRFVSNRVQPTTVAPAAAGGGMGGKIAGGASMAGMGAMMYGMSGGPGADIAAMASLPLMMAPMLGKFAPLIIAIGGLVVGAIALKGAFDKAQKEALEMANTLGAGKDAMESYSEFAGTVSAGDIMDRQRQDAASPFNIQQGKTTFGQSFVTSDQGKTMLDSLRKSMNTSGSAATQAQLVNQLGTAVTSGVLTEGQARSIAAGLAQELGDASFGIKVNAELIDIFGPNGENLVNEPLEVRMRMIAQTQDQIKSVAEASRPVQAIGATQTAGGSALALGGAAATAVAGLVAFGIGAQAVPGPGTVAGAIALATAGTIALGVGIWQGVEGMTKMGEVAGANVGIGMIAMQQQKEMLDSLDLEYQKRIANAIAAGDLAKAEELTTRHIQEREALLVKNAETTDLVLDNFDNQLNIFGQKSNFMNFNQGSYKDAVSNSVDKAYEDDPTMQLVAKGAKSAIINASGLDDTQEHRMMIMLANKELDPQFVIELMGMFGDDKEEMERVLSIFTKIGTADGGRAIALLRNFVGPDGEPLEEEQRTFLANIEAKTPAEARKALAMFEEVSKLQGANIVDVGVIMSFYNKNPQARADMEETIEKINSYNGEIGMDFVQTLVGADQFEAFKENQTYFESLDPEQRKDYVSAYVNTLALEGDPAMQDAYKLWLTEPGNAGKMFDAFAVVQSVKVTEAGIDNTAVDIEEEPDPGGGSGPAASSLDDILKKLRDIRKNQVGVAKGFEASAAAINKLFGGGAGINLFSGIENDMRRLGAEENLIDLIVGMSPEDFEKQKNTLFNFDKQTGEIIGFKDQLQNIGRALSAIALGQYVTDQQRSAKESRNQVLAFNQLRAAGYSVADAYEAVQDAAVASAIATGNVTRDQMTTMLQELRSAQEAMREAARLTPEGLQEVFEDGFNKAMEAFDVKEKKLTLDYEFKIKDDKALIDEAQNQIASIQYELDDYEADLRRIEIQEEAINKTYDDKLEALEKVRNANQKILDQEKGRLSVAEAITRGDLSATARAIQDLRATSASGYFSSQTDALNAGRQSALDQVRSENGLSRIEIEEKIKDLTNTIFEIEEKTLEPAQRRIDLATIELEKRISEEKVLERTKGEWEEIKTNIDLARVNSAGYKSAMDEALAVVQDVLDAWNEIEKPKETIHTIITVREGEASPAGPAGPGGTGSDPLDPDLDTPEAQANRIRTTLNDRATAGKVSTALRNAVGVGNSTNDRADALINSYLAKITKSQADAILSEAGLLGGPAPTTGPKGSVNNPHTTGISPGMSIPNGKAVITVPLDSYVKMPKGFYIQNGTVRGNVIDLWYGTQTQRWGQIKGNTVKAARTTPYDAYAVGGFVSGPGTPTSDSIPALLSDGEYVVKASSVDKFGTGFLDSINAGQLPGYRLGGLIRDGGGSSKSTPKPVGRVSADAAERRALAAKPTTALGWVMASSQASTAAAAAQAAAQRQRDTLYQQGGFQGFEAGFGSLMNVVGQNPIVQAVGNIINNSPAIKSLIAVASTPLETMGAIVKNVIESGAKAYSQASQGDFIGAAGTMALNALTIIPKSMIEGGANAFSGVLDSNNAKPSMFEQANQAAYNANLFNAQNNPEMAALGRIIGGSLSIAADPLTYLGIGAVAKLGTAAKTAAALRNTAEGVSPGVTRQTVDLGMGTGQWDDYAFSTQAFQIGSNKPILFEGPGQDFSKLAESGFKIVQPSPAGMIQEALDMLSPGSPLIPGLKSMLDNFKNGAPGPREQDFLLQMQASAFLKDSGVLSGGDLGGLATFISSLAGDARAAAIVSNNVERIKEMSAANKLAAGVTDHVFGDGSVADLDKVAAFRSLGDFRVTRQANGDILLDPPGNFMDEVARASLHWTAGGVVEDHGFQNFGGVFAQKIVTPLKQLMDDNGLPYTMDTNDISFNVNPGQQLRVSDGILVSPNSPANHLAELVRRGIIKPGETAPTIAYDEALKEVLFELQDTYSAADIDRLSNMGLNIRPGSEHVGITDEALRIATGKLGIDSRIRHLDKDTTNDADFNDAFKNLAAQLGVDQNLHGGTFGARYEYINPTKSIGLDDSSFHTGGDFDSLEALRHFAIKGYFRSPTSFENMGPGLAKGGLVKPKFFANGGFVSKGTDTIPAMLSNGEYVIKSQRVKQFGTSLFDNINSGSLSSVQSMSSPSFSSGSPSVSVSQSSVPSRQAAASSSNSVYNYSLSVNVASQADPNTIAQTVMAQLQRVDSQRVRNGRF